MRCGPLLPERRAGRGGRSVDALLTDESGGGAMSQEQASSEVRSLRSLITGYETSQVIYLAARLGMADQLATEPRTAEDLAETLRLDPGALHRLLHALAALGLVSHLGGSRYA